MNTQHSELLLDVRGVGKCHRIYARPQDRLIESLTGHRRKYHREFWALHDISMQISRGEAIGIIGRNGAGKSTLLQIIAGTMAPTRGSVRLSGRVAALLQLGSGFNSDFTGTENVFLNGAILGFTRDQIASRFREIADFAEIGEFMDQPIKNYSSGMVMRLAFAVSTCLEPDILIVDEALAVGDALFQRKCYARIEEFVERGGTLLFVSHSLETIRRVCNRAYYLKDGTIRLGGRPAEVIAAYEHDLDASNMIAAATATQSEEPATFNDYGNKAARISQTWIENHHGHKADRIEIPDPFRWCYTVDFSSYSNNVTFGMRMVNVEGQVIYATNSRMIDCGPFAVAAGRRQVVRFNLPTEALPPGDYFLSAGVSELVDGHDQFLHRRTDVGFVRVSESALPRYFGMINIRAELTVE